ncbi:MAG: S1 RNA-binding domain-containing protein, partial [Planctomycetaceae bacterium]|nr:S1 RNA-binding domain-containing protein [Planctomycetaceae bacterium]
EVASTEEPSPPPETETPQPEVASTEEPSPTLETETRSRPQLNPTVDPNAAKPVPSLDSSNAAPPPSTPVVETSESEDTKDSKPASPPPSAEVIPKSIPAEIPKSADLDADLEAQIAAAQASDEATGSQPVPPPQQPAAEATEGESAPAKPPEAPAPTSEEELEPGYKLSGKVQSVSGDDVFFDVGFRSPALVSIRQFDPEKQPEVGQTFHIVVDKVNATEGLIYANLPRGKRKIQGNWDAVEVGQVVDCMVTKTNKGGLEITVSNLRGFLPASQVDMYFVPDLEKYVGEKLTVKITEANRAKRNLIVSRRQYLQDEREAQAQDIWKNLEVGQSRKGVVKTIKDYGAFVDIGGVDGFLHIGEISWSRIRHPSDVLSESQEIDVQILSLDEDRQRIGLGMRQLAQNPWEVATQKYAPGSNVSGRVTRTTDFGAFVELEPGVEGLVHISELDYRRVNKVNDVLNVGDEPELKVLDIDLGRKRISLSLK